MENRHKMFPTPYPDLNRVLRDLVDRAQAVLSDNFVGAYLQGSFAMGDFDLHSDVDFIVVIEEELSHEEVHGLQAVHKQIYSLDIPWAQHLEGSYFPQEVLRDHARLGEQLWYLDHGSRSLIQSAHCNTALVRWVVRELGVCLAGPSPARLVDPIPVETLRKEIIATLHDWGQEILSNPDPYKTLLANDTGRRIGWRSMAGASPATTMTRPGKAMHACHGSGTPCGCHARFHPMFHSPAESYNNRFYQGFIVLNYCRMLHDLHRGFPGSKLAGAEWAKANLDPSWKGLIDRAWNGRPDPAVSGRQRADAKDFKATLEFVRYCRNKANT